MTRSEEELRVGTTSREAGRASPAQVGRDERGSQTVPVAQEEVRIEREPITGGTSGPVGVVSGPAEVRLTG